MHNCKWLQFGNVDFWHGTHDTVYNLYIYIYIYTADYVATFTINEAGTQNSFGLAPVYR